MSHTELILASTSPYRRALLDRLGLRYRAVSHRADERSLEAAWGNIAPEMLVRKLAEAKAASVRDAYPDAIILGSDQVVSMDGAVLGKPGTAEGACAQLAQLQGRSHLRLVEDPDADDVRH